MRAPLESLPLDKSGPPGNTWGIHRPQDEFGAFGFLTPAVVARAAQQLRTGDRVSVYWHMKSLLGPISTGRNG